MAKSKSRTVEVGPSALEAGSLNPVIEEMGDKLTKTAKEAQLLSMVDSHWSTLQMMNHLTASSRLYARVHDVLSSRKKQILNVATQNARWMTLYELVPASVMAKLYQLDPVTFHLLEVARLLRDEMRQLSERIEERIKEQSDQDKIS